MKIQVKTKFNGMVAFREKYMGECKIRKEDLIIECEGEVMTVPWKEFDKRIRFTKPVKDKFSKATHRLIYMWWQKDGVGKKEHKNQLRLL